MVLRDFVETNFTIRLLVIILFDVSYVRIRIWHGSRVGCSSSGDMFVHMIVF